MSERLRALAGTDPARAAAILADIQKRMLVPHAGGQVEVLDSDARFKVVRAGRRWGKTKVAARETVRSAFENPGSVNWWVANRWRNTRRGYKAVVAQIPPRLLAKPAPQETSNDLNLYLKNGSVIEFYSGESPDSMAGEGVTHVVMDEAALQRANVWQQIIRPTLMDTGGRAMLISTPRGRNWFYHAWYRKHPDWESWHFPQSSNPYVPNSETEDARLELPALFFAQEIMAEFVDNAASIFRVGGDNVIVPSTKAPDGAVIGGIDFARKEDFSVLTAANADTRLPCYHDRFTDLSWPIQVQRVKDANSWLLAQGATSVSWYVDATGLGDVLVDDLEMEGLDITPIKFSAPWKLQAVKLLAADLEQGRAHILEEQRTEFESYEYEITDSGQYRFEAATGHDDEVSAKLLEHWGLANEGVPNINVVTYGPEDLVDEDEEEADEPIVPDDAAEMMRRPEVWA